MHRCLSLGLLLVLCAACTHGADFALPTLATASGASAGGGELAYNKEFMSGILQAFISPAGVDRPIGSMRAGIEIVKMGNVLEAFKSPKGVNVMRLLEAFNPTPCLQKCMTKMGDFLDSLGTTQSPRDTRNTVSLCWKLAEIEECAAASHCDSKMLDLATRVPCSDKIESLDDSLKFIREVQEVFARDCSVDWTLLHVDPAKLPVCKSSVCLLGCMQKSINALSRGNTPSLFNAILTTSTSTDDNTLSPLLSGMLPTHCRDVLKAQASLPERIAQLAAISKDSAFIRKKRSSMNAHTPRFFPHASPSIPPPSSTWWSNIIRNGKVLNFSCTLSLHGEYEEAVDFVKVHEIFNYLVREKLQQCP